MTATTDVIALATRIQRRRDFGAHLLGFILAAAVLTGLHLAEISAGAQLVGSLLAWAWATALSTQHIRHVLRGPVTAADVDTERTRLTCRRP